MGFGGSTAAMVQAIRNNAKQLTKRKNYFEKDVSSGYKKSTKFVDYKKMSSQEFEMFKNKLKKEESRRMKKLVLVFGSVMSVIIGIVIYLLFFY